MSATLTVNIRGLSGQVSLEVPEGSTIGDVREAADINSGLSFRSGGQTLDDDYEVADDQILVTTAPEAKHGSR